MTQQPAIHPAARQGFSSAAQAYGKGRPDYPEELLDWLQADLGLRPGDRALDLGAGTGKFTRLPMLTGAFVSAVEPVDEMRAQLAARYPAVFCAKGTAERIPLVDGAMDVVLCAQAFHWFANDAALREIHRVLRPGGWLGLVWNVRDESVDWVAELTRIVTPHEGDAPRFYKGDWRLPFEAAPELFSPLQLRTFDYTHVGPPQQVIIERFMSVSFIAALPPEGRAQVRAQLDELIATHPALRGREEVAFPYRTEAYRCQRL